MRRTLAPVLVVVVTACASPLASVSSRDASTSSPSAPDSAPSARATPRPSREPTPTPVPTPAPITWVELEDDGPPAREDATWTVGGDGRTAYLFGGRDGATVFDDLWAYDLAEDAWSEIGVSGGPAARFGHEAAWIDGAGLVVTFGQAGTAFFNDVWAFDPATRAWRELPSAEPAPRARYGSCSAVGSDGRLWISHGFTADGARFADTWAYDAGAATWSEVTPDGDVPVNRCLHGCWWTDDDALALYAGQTTGVTAIGDRWELRDGAWRSVERTGPPERNLPAQVRIGGATFVVGGQGVDGGYRSDAWLLPDGGAAVAVTWDGTGPPGRAGASMVRHEDRLLLFGGRDADGARADTWVLTGVAP